MVGLIRFDKISNAEILFLSFYFVGVVAPMFFVMALSFMVGKEWRPTSEAWRMGLVKWMANAVESMKLANSYIWALTVVCIGGVMVKCEFQVVPYIWIGTNFILFAWLAAWNHQFPMQRAVDMLVAYSYRRKYPQLVEVTDGFGH